MQYIDFEHRVRVYENDAAEDPKGYRRRVILWACLGYGYVAMLGAALLALVGGLIFLAFFSKRSTGGSFIALLKFGIPALLAALAIGRALFIRSDKLEGYAVTKTDSPRLFKLLHNVRKKVKGPAIHQVLLTDEFNAAIVQRKRFGIWGDTRNTLILGMQLMQALSTRQLAAVIAHEYGHLSGAHGKLQSWVYRSRMAWWHTYQSLDEQDHWSVLPLTAFLRWYCPRFYAMSFVLAREDEYEADRVAAKVAGEQAAADALCATAIHARFLDEFYWPKVFGMANESPKPPRSVLSRIPTALKAGFEEAESRRALTRELKRETGVDDTHPSLNDRLNALNARPRIPPLPEEPAALTLFGSKLKDHIAILESMWRKSVRPGWDDRYKAVLDDRTEMSALQTSARTQPLKADDEFRLAQLVESSQGGDWALPRYRAVLERAPNHAGALFAAARLMLQRSDDRGIDLLDRAIQAEPGITMTACGLAIGYLRDQHRTEDAQRFERMRNARYDAEQAALQDVWNINALDAYVKHDLAAAQLRELSRQLIQVGEVRAAYLAMKPSSRLPDLRVYVLAVERAARLRLTDNSSAFMRRLDEHTDLPGRTMLVLLDSDTKALGEVLKGIPGSLVLKRS